MVEQQNENVAATAVWGAGADAGTINELANGAPGEAQNTHASAGVISFSDTVIEHSHSISVVEPTSSLGTFTAFVLDPANGDGSGTALWQYFVHDAAIEHLGAGETITETYVMVLVDDQGAEVSKEVSVTITGKNDAPEISVSSPGAVISELADDDAVEGTTEHTAEGTVEFSDLDLSDDHTVSVASPSGHKGVLTATLAQDASGGNTGIIAWNYVVSDGALDELAEGETLVESFEVSIDDGHGGVTTTTVDITLTGTNDAPVIDGAVAVFTDEDQASVVVDLLSNATDVDGDTLSVANVGVTVSDGRVLDYSIDLQTGALVLNPGQFNDLAEGESITINIDYAVSDGRVAVGASAVVTIEGRNDAPVAVADIAIVTEDVTTDPVTGNVLDNDTDVDGDTLQVVSVNGQPGAIGQYILGTYGSLLLNADGSYSYLLDNTRYAVQSLAEGQSEIDSFEYVISDGNGGTAFATVNVTVNGTNDAPVVAGGFISMGEAGTIDYRLHGTDIDGDALTFELISGPANGSVVVNADGSATVTANDGFVGGDSFTYRVTDTQGVSREGTVSLTVGNVFDGDLKVAYADSNNDGNLDALLSDGTGRVWTRLGDGGGGFGIAQYAGYGAEPGVLGENLDAQYADIDGDGNVDAVFNSAEGKFWSRSNSGNYGGSFEPGQSYGFGSILGQFAHDLTVSHQDINQDGYADALISSSGGSLWARFGNLAGGFGDVQALGIGTSTILKNESPNYTGRKSAFSRDALSGAVSMTVVATEIGTSRAIGFGTSVAGNIGLNTIAYGLNLSYNGRLMVFALPNTSRNIDVGKYQEGDLLGIERQDDGTIAFTRNGDIIYKSPVKSPTDTPLYVQSSFHTVNGTLGEVSVTENGITSLVDDWVAHKEINTGTIGNDITTRYADVNGDGNIDALMSASDGRIWTRLGDGAGSFGALQETGDGATLPNSPSQSDVSVSYHDMNGDDFLDALVSDDSGRIKVRLGDSTGSFGDFEPLRGPLTKTSGVSGWNAIAHSSESFVGSGRLILTSPYEVAHKIVGLSSEPGAGVVGYGFHIWSNGLLGIIENGQEIGRFGSHHYGYELSIVRDESGIVSFIQNGEVLYTSAIISPPTEPLFAEAVIHTYGGTSGNVFIGAEGNDPKQVGWIPKTNNVDIASYGEGIETQYADLNGDGIVDAVLNDTAGRLWTHLGNNNGGFDPIRALGVGLQTRLSRQFDKTPWGSNVGRWSVGAHAYEQLNGQGSLSVVATETNRGRLIGFSTEVSEREFSSYNYAIYLRKDGLVAVYENGIEYLFGTYHSGEVFGIERRNDGTIVYSRDGVVFYNSTIPSDLGETLFIEVSFDEIGYVQNPSDNAGGTIGDVFLSSNEYSQQPVSWVENDYLNINADITWSVDQDLGVNTLDDGFSLDFHDVNGDGNIDALISDNEGHIWTRFGDGKGGFGALDYSLTLTGGTGDDLLSGKKTRDTIIGGDGNDVISGNENDDILFGGAGDDTLSGGIGNDVLNGGSGADTFMFGSGDGADKINDADNSDHILLGTGLNEEDVWLFQQDNDLIIQMLGSQDRLTVADWFSEGAASHVDQIELASGAYLNGGNVQALVDAMSVFGVDAISLDSISHNSTDYNNVQVVIAANWQNS